MTNIDQTSENNKSEPSRQVRRQAGRENEKRKKTRLVNRYYNALYKAGLACALLTIPPRTKVPRIYNKDGSHSPHSGWPNGLTLEQIKIANLFSDVGVGILGKYILGLDYDGESPELAALIHRLADKYLGLSIIRGRPNSYRFLRGYKQKFAEPPLKKLKIKFKDKQGNEHQVERIGDGNFWVAAGIHPSGVEYTYKDGADLCAWGPPNLETVGDAEWTPFECELISEAKKLGFEVVEKGGVSGTGTRKVLPDATLAGDAEHLREILKAIPCDDETIQSRDEYIQVAVAFKAAAGKHANDLFPDFLEWSMGYPGAEPDYIEKIWASVHDATIGFSWFEGWARGHGYHGDAQADFADTPQPDGAPIDPNAGIPETPYDRMLEQFVWVKSLGQYNDTEDGSFLDSKTFNAVNVEVKPFGSSGQQSAEAEFQNAKGARKVTTATSRPGKPVILTETNDRGIKVDAVNLWRPSLVKADLFATTADVAPWLDLVNLLFGVDAPEREHFLRWWAHVLQRPGEKIGHALVIIGGQGVGKDTVLRPLFEAVGLHNVASIDTAALMGQFNPFLKAQIIYAQELITYGRRDLYNTLKPYISAQATRLAVNEKNLRQYYVPNNQNWVVTSNYDNAISLEDDDRRFWVHKALIDEAPSDDYFAKLYAWLDAGGTEKVFGWLRRFDLAGFNPMAKPPLTAAKRIMLEASWPKPVGWLREQLREGGSLAHRRVVTVHELCTLPRSDWTAPVGEISDKQVMTALKGEGFKPAHRVRIGNAMRQLWARGLDGSVTADEMKVLYSAETGSGEASCKAA